MRTGAELFLDAVQQYGIREVFTLVGDHLNDVLLSAGQRNFRIFDVRHEASAVHAADAWARIHRRPALSLVTGGPGHTNSLTGLATAYSAGSPVLAVSGSRPSTQARRGAFQDVDQIGSAGALVKWAAEPPSADQIPFYVGRALAEATSGRSGPVHLTIPVDLFAATVGQPPALPVPVQTARPTPAVDEIARLLQSAERPVAIAGSGVWWSGAERELQEFAEHSGVPVFTISLGRGVLPDSHPLCFGHADPALNRAAVRAYADADLVLVLGKRMDFRLGVQKRPFAPAATVVQVDIHPPEFGMNHPVDVAVCADVKQTLRALIRTPGTARRPDASWLGRLGQLRCEWQSWLDGESQTQDSPIHPAALFAELRRLLPEDLLYSWDGGDFVHWGRAMLPARHPGGWLRLGPLATIGAALPNALALQMAHPERRVALITGDGALGFYIAELDTAVRHNLPIIVIVGNDAGWGLERELQGGTQTVGCELRGTRYDIVMKGFGGEGETIERLEELAPALDRAFRARRPYLLNVMVRGARSPFTRWKLGDPPL